MKWLINWVGFDIMVMLPTLCITAFCAWQYHCWAPLIFLGTGYIAGWIISWKII